MNKEEPKEANIHVLELATYTQPKIVESNRFEYVEYGEKNNHYDWIIGRYKHSTTSNAVINNIAKLIYGKGISALNANKKPNEYAMLKAMVSPKALRGVALNFKMLGAGYFQVMYNKNHTKIIKADYIQTRLIRAEKCNEDGEITGYWYSDNWDDLRNFPARRYPAFGTSKEAIEIECVKFESIDMKYYTDVDYLGALPYAVLEEEIADFQINDVKTHFSGRVIVNYNNGVPTPEQQRTIAKKTKQQLSGAKGDSVIIAFNANQEGATTVDTIPLSDAPEHYAYLSTEAQSKILNGHTVISPMIVGITTENSGFSSNADEIEMATKVFYNQSIMPFQEAILESVDKFLAFNGSTLDLYFKRLNLMDSIEEKQQAKEETALKMSNDLNNLVSSFGEDESEDWVLIDEREVDYDNEEDLDLQIEEAEKELEPTKLSKVWNLLSTGKANPNRKSSQDAEKEGFYFKVRYKYTGNANAERGFCKAMMSADKLYRKEDIANMSSQIVNAGFGEFGGDFYDIFKFKGGPRCHHKWVRKTFVSASKKQNVKNPDATTVSTNKARKFGYKPTNSKEVAMKPNDMKHKGFSPNNNNRPKDAQ